MSEEMQESKMSASEVFKSSRKKLGITQDALARLFGCNPALISRNESGDRKSKLASSFAYIVAALLEEPLDNDPEKRVDPDEVLQALESIDKKRRSELSAFVAVHRLAYSKKRFDAIADYLGEDVPDHEDIEDHEEGEEGGHMLGLSSRMEDYRRRLRSHAKKVGGAARNLYQDSELLLAQLIARLEQAEDAEEEQRRLSREDNQESPDKG